MYQPHFAFVVHVEMKQSVATLTDSESYMCDLISWDLGKFFFKLFKVGIRIRSVCEDNCKEYMYMYMHMCVFLIMYMCIFIVCVHIYILQYAHKCVYSFPSVSLCLYIYLYIYIYIFLV